MLHVVHVPLLSRWLILNGITPSLATIISRTLAPGDSESATPRHPSRQWTSQGIHARPLNGFDDHRYALTASDAEGGETVLLLALLEFVEYG